MIILEGPDNAGKTTLGQELLQVTDYPLKHSPGPFDTEEEMIDYLQETLEDRHEGRRILYDRHPIISEAVYGPVLRGSHGLQEFRRKLYHDVFIQMYPLIIYCRPPIEVILDVDEEHLAGEDRVNPKLEEIVYKYDELMVDLMLEKGSTVTVIHYDYTGNYSNTSWPLVRRAVRQYPWDRELGG